MDKTSLPKERSNIRCSLLEATRGVNVLPATVHSTTRVQQISLCFPCGGICVVLGVVWWCGGVCVVAGVLLCSELICIVCVCLVTSLCYLLYSVAMCCICDAKWCCSVPVCVVLRYIMLSCLPFHWFICWCIIFYFTSWRRDVL